LLLSAVTRPFLREIKCVRSKTFEYHGGKYDDLLSVLNSAVITINRDMS